jgi:hypothetical protein
VDPKSNDWCPYKRKDRDTRKRACDERHRLRDIAASNARSTDTRRKEEFFPRTFSGSMSLSTIIVDFLLQNLER